MTNDNMPPMLGLSGKTFWMAASDMSSLVDKKGAADTFIGNCTTSLTLNIEFDSKDKGHRVMVGTTREGMSGMLSGTRDVNNEIRDSEEAERTPAYIIDPSLCNARTGREL